MLFASFACFVLFAFVLWIIIKSRRKCRLPPEPKGSFIFGNAFQLKLRKFALQMAEFGKTFDDAYTIRIFSQKFVMLNSYDMIKEGMTSPKYARIMSGRPPSFLADTLAQDDIGVQTYSEHWAALKKTVLRGMRTYGTHMAEVEALVQEELKHLVSRIRNEAGKSVDPYDYICGYVISIILMLVTGQHAKHGDRRIKLCNDIAESSDCLTHPVYFFLLTAFPWLRRIPLGIGSEYQRMKQNLDDLKQTVYQAVERKTDRKPCFLDFMLDEKSKGHVTEDSVSSVCFADLLNAGTGTSRTTLHILLLVLTSRPDVQSKIQEEIDREVGTTRLPCAEDKHRMPYTQAVLWETFRLYCPVPLSLPHCTMEDVEFRNYFLPKNTVVYYNIWNLVHDETFWKDPWEFRPSRFLDDAGQFIPPEDEKRQRTITFGIGKCLCVGEVLARLRIFLACVAILQNFTLRPDPTSPIPKADPRTFDVGVLLTVPRYKLIFHPKGPN